MAKAKAPKLGLPFLTTAIQICRPKHPSSMVRRPGPLPAALDYFSPFSSFHVSFPNFPDPPSTPNTARTKHNAGSSKIAPQRDCEGPSEESYTSHGKKPELIDDFPSHGYYSRTRRLGKESVCLSSSSNGPSSIEKKEKTMARKSEANCKRNNFSPSHSPNNPLETEPVNRSCKRSTKPRRFSEQRLKGARSKDYWDNNTKAAPKSRPKEGKHISEKRVNNEEGFVVVKRSDDPYEDFKKSMLEMIVEKQLSEPRELEQLLMSFLSLNSRLHHTVILQAFTQILKDLYGP